MGEFESNRGLGDRVCQIVTGSASEASTKQRAPGKSTTREVARNFRLAAAELIKAAEEVEDIPSDLLRHQREQAEREPEARTGLAMRMAGEGRRMMRWV